MNSVLYHTKEFYAPSLSCREHKQKQNRHTISQVSCDMYYLKQK